MAEENKLKLVESIIKSIVGIILPFILVWMLLSHNPTSLNSYAASYFTNN